jgi:hypothetical protein
MALLNLYRYHTEPDKLLHYEQRADFFDKQVHIENIASYVHTWLIDFWDIVSEHADDGSTKGILSRFMADDNFEISLHDEGNHKVFLIEINNEPIGHILLTRAEMVASTTGFHKQLNYTDIDITDMSVVDDTLNEFFDDIARSL